MLSGFFNNPIQKHHCPEYITLVLPIHPLQKDQWLVGKEQLEAVYILQLFFTPFELLRC